MAGNAQVTQVASLLKQYVSQMYGPVHFGTVKKLIVENGQGFNLSLTDDQLAQLAQHMESIRGRAFSIPLLALRNDLVIHYKKNTTLQRLFDNSSVSIQKSYINLSILESQEQREKEAKFKGVDQAKVLQEKNNWGDERIPSYEELFSIKQPIKLSELFSPQKAREEPRKLLIQGRAGIGKSIFCQYLAIQWALGPQPEMRCEEGENNKPERDFAGNKRLPWLEKFQAVFLLNLREVAAGLKGKPKDQGTLEYVINEWCLDKQYLQKMPALTESLGTEGTLSQCLFILDGFDEIYNDWADIENSKTEAIRQLWATLLTQRHIIVTSRPMDFPFWQDTQDKSIRRLEIMGFTNKNIEAYINDFMKEDKAEAQEGETLPAPLLKYLKKHPSIWGIAHIPINLEMLCWLYKKGDLKLTAGTLSELYTEMVAQVTREMSELKKRKEGSYIRYPDLNAAFKEGCPQTTKKIAKDFLEALAYEGMIRNELLITSKTIKNVAKQVLEKNGEREDDTRTLTEKLLTAGHQLGFLKSTQQGGRDLQEQSHYFIHLSFQEFFAARYVARELDVEAQKSADTAVARVETLIVSEHFQANKHQTRYQLMWWLTAGFLAKEEQKPQGLKLFWDTLLFSAEKSFSLTEFELVAHCLDECLGIEPNILPKFLTPAQHKNLIKKMQTYFNFVVFYNEFTIKHAHGHGHGQSIEILLRCPNFTAMKKISQKLCEFMQTSRYMDTERIYIEVGRILLANPNIKGQAAQWLVTLAQDPRIGANERRTAWESLLEDREYAKEGAEGLKALAQDVKIGAFERVGAWESLLALPEYAKEAAEGLKILAQDLSIGANERRTAWESLLAIPECEKEVAEGLKILSQDSKIGAFERVWAWEILLALPEYAKEGAEGLKILAQDPKLEANERRTAWKILLENHEYAKEGAKGLKILAQDPKIGAFERVWAWEILLENRKYTKEGAEGLKALAQDPKIEANERRTAWKILLENHEYAKEGAEGLKTLAQDPKLEANERRMAWESLLENREYAKEGAEGLKILAQDPKIRAYERMRAWKSLLENREYAKEGAEGLKILAQDAKIETNERRTVWEILLENREYAKEGAEGLKALAQDPKIEANERRTAWKILLENHEHAKEAAEGLKALAQDPKIGAFERVWAWEILLENRKYTKEAAEGLKILAQDPKIEANERRTAWESLLENYEHAKEAAAGLKALAQDVKIEANERRRAWKSLLENREYAKEGAEGLKALAQDPKIEAEEKVLVWKSLLENREYAKEAAEELKALAQDPKIEAEEKVLVWKSLLKNREYAKEVAEGLKALAQDPSIGANERRMAWKILLENHEYAKEGAEGLKALAQDPKLEANERRMAWESLLKNHEYDKEGAEGLKALAQDPKIEAEEKVLVWKSLLKDLLYAQEGAAGLKALAQDVKIGAFVRRRAWESLLAIPEYAKEAAEGLKALAQDPKIEAEEKVLVWKSLLKNREYAKEAAEGLMITQSVQQPLTQHGPVLFFKTATNVSSEDNQGKNKSQCHRFFSKCTIQ